MGWPKRVLIVFGWIFAGLVLLVASAVYHAQLPVARRIVRDAVNRVVTGEISGELAIGQLESVKLDHIVARWVTLYDALGRRVIVADRVDLYPDFAALRGNVLRFKVAQLKRGTVRMVDDGSGTPTWIGALNPRVSGPPSLNPLHALLDHIELEDVTVYGDYLGLEGFRVENLNARGKLDIHHEARVRIDGGKGVFVLPFPYPGLIDDVRGSIDTDVLHGVDLTVEARRERGSFTTDRTSPDDERARAHVTYKSAAVNLPEELRVSLETDEVTPDSLRGLGYTWLGPIDVPLRGHVELFGPTEHLSIEADVDSAAGSARASGTISDTQGVSVHVMTGRLELPLLIQDAPEITLKGTFHVAAPPGDEPARVHVSLAPTRYKAFNVPAFEMDGRLEDDRVIIERARSSQGGRLSVSGSVGYDTSIDLRVDATLPAVHREPNLAHYVENLEAQLQAAVRIRVPADRRAINIDGKVELVDVRYASIRASRVIVSGVAKGDPELPQVDVQVTGENVHVFDYALGVASFALQGGPSAYQAQGEFSPSPGQKTFYFDANIAATKKQFVIQADPIEFVFGQKTFRGAARDLTIIAGQSVSLGSLRLASGAERLEASGIMRVRGEDDVRADLQHFDLGALHALLGDPFPFKQGNADATVEIHGDIARPELLVQGAMRGGHVLDVQNVDAMYFVTYKDGTLDLDTQLEVAGHGSLHLAGQGKLDARIADPLQALEGGYYDLELSSTDFDLLVIPAMRQVLHQSRVSGTMTISGGLDAPKLEGNASIAGFCLMNMQPVDVAGEFDYDGARATANVEVSDTVGKLANFAGHVVVPWERLREDPKRAARELGAGSWQLRGSTEARGLEQFPFDVPASARMPFALGTRFDLAHEPGSSRGTIKFGAQGLDKFSDESCKLDATTQSSAEVTISGQHLRAKFEMLLDGQRIVDGEARLDMELERWLAGTDPFRILRADATAHADIADIERVPVLCRHGHGDLHVDVRLDSLFTPEQRAQVDLIGSLNPHVRVLEGRQRRVVESCRDDPARVWMQSKVDGKQITTQAWLEGCYGGHSDLVASVPLKWGDGTGTPSIDGDRDIRVQVDFGEAQLRPLLDRTPGVLGFGATANGRIVAQGNKKRVSYTGQVGLTDGRLYLLATGQELNHIEATLVGNGNWVKVEGLSARTGAGSLEATGGIGFDRWTPSKVQLGLIVKQLPVQREGLELASLTGSAALSTEIGPEVAQSAVKIHSLSIKMPNTSSRSLQSLEPHPDVLVTTAKPKEAAEKPYTFDFFVDGQRGVTASRNDFDVTLATELALQYADPEFRVGGYVEFRRGTFEVFGKQFEVNRGSLQFNGGPELNPEVNLIATQRPEAGADSTAGKVTARVSGTLANPVVEFYSETCPGQGAVVLLVSGRCPSDADNTLQDTTGTQNAFAAGIVGGILTLGARSQLGGLIPRISVESTGQGAQTRVKAGFEAVPKFMRPLVQRVYVQGALSTKDQTAAEGSANESAATPDFLIELYFPHNIVGTGRVAPTSRSWGLDVTWEP
jgi:autotransporter translocation and assembly factor TamB